MKYIHQIITIHSINKIRGISTNQMYCGQSITSRFTAVTLVQC